MERKINSYSCRRVIEAVLRSPLRVYDVVAERHGRRTVGAKGISCRVNEAILHREVQNLSRDSDTIVLVLHEASAS
jgi:hypothetical protein